MSDEPKLPLLQRMRENERLVGIWFKRMLKDAREFGEIVHRNQTTSYMDRKKSRDDDWNVDNR